MEDNCFTILCWFLPYVTMNQPEAYICPFPVEPPSYLPLHPTLLGCYRASDWAPCWHIANSHWLSILHMVMHMFPHYSLNLSNLIIFFKRWSGKYCQMQPRGQVKAWKVSLGSHRGYWEVSLKWWWEGDILQEWTVRKRRQLAWAIFPGVKWERVRVTFL